MDWHQLYVAAVVAFIKPNKDSTQKVVKKKRKDGKGELMQNEKLILFHPKTNLKHF